MSLGLGWSRIAAIWGSRRMSEGFWIGADCAQDLWSEAVSDASRAQKTAENVVSLGLLSLSCYVLTCPLSPPCVGAGQTCGQTSSQAGAQGDTWMWYSAWGNLSACKLLASSSVA